LDGKKATVAKVRKALAKASSEKGTVWYYRESGKGEPPSQAVEIVKLVVENRLPISLSSRPDFSDLSTTKANPAQENRHFAACSGSSERKIWVNFLELLLLHPGFKKFHS
jgi:hypothetical protein